MTLFIWVLNYAIIVVLASKYDAWEADSCRVKLDSRGDFVICRENEAAQCPSGYHTIFGHEEACKFEHSSRITEVDGNPFHGKNVYAIVCRRYHNCFMTVCLPFGYDVCPENDKCYCARTSIVRSRVCENGYYQHKLCCGLPWNNRKCFWTKCNDAVGVHNVIPEEGNKMCQIASLDTTQRPLIAGDIWTYGAHKICENNEQSQVSYQCCIRDEIKDDCDGSYQEEVSIYTSKCQYLGYFL